ncbi:TonB-dependent siderophore receptor [Luteolibacter yonseiensis]|uniref:TonB-dependent siderophore receptor n=1 Tax=Luteolibacter yonseiensis TaxID=1144680 RepID=A0A934R521_9BACT|nr:TonB-dependent siderophore receptor [Luteolibacter yonseiensis]MBK1815314.1 TonB-dependent siderophore receptor [Luteolibacter yonseiensis]
MKPAPNRFIRPWRFSRIQPGLPLLVGTAACIGLVQAQEAAPKTNADGSTVLDTLTVTASRDGDARILDYNNENSTVGTKTTTPLLETPQSISVITEDQIVTRNAQGVAEALRYTAGTSTEAYGQDPRGYDWVNIRGFDAFNSRYLDGLRLQNYEFPEIFGLERVEVIKGPSSVLYGQSVAGGVINAISKRPKETAFGEVAAEIGTHESYEATLDVGSPLTADGSVLYRLTGLFRDSQEDSNGFPVDASRYYIAPALTWKISPDTKIDFRVSYFHGESTQTPSYASAPDGSPTNVKAFGYGKWDYEENDILNLNYQLEHRISRDLAFRQNLRASSYNVQDKYLNSMGYQDDGSGNPTTIMDRTASIWDSDSLSLGIDSQLEYKIRGSRVEQTLLGGFDYSWASADTVYYDDPVGSIDISDPDYGQPIQRPTSLQSDSYQKSTQYGLYLQDQIKFDSKWVVTLSGRHDWAETEVKERTLSGTPDFRSGQDDSAFTGRAGLTYLADNGLAPYASVSSSFYPNSGLDISGNTFDPTEGTQYEIGLKYAPKNFRGGATLSLYDITQSNVLTSNPADAAYYEASGEWRSRGIEFEGNLGITDNLDLLVNTTLGDVEITESEDGDEGNTPGLTPEKSASTWLNYTFRDGTLKGLILGGGVRYVGTSYSSSSDTARKNSDYTVLDLAARYVSGPWTYALNVNNVFDTVEWIDTEYQYNKTAGNSVNLSVAYHW